MSKRINPEYFKIGLGNALVRALTGWTIGETTPPLIIMREQRSAGGLPPLRERIKRDGLRTVIGDELEFRIFGFRRG